MSAQQERPEEQYQSRTAKFHVHKGQPSSSYSTFPTCVGADIVEAAKRDGEAAPPRNELPLQAVQPRAAALHLQQPGSFLQPPSSFLHMRRQNCFAADLIQRRAAASFLPQAFAGT
jgi:hypothetical protein